MLGTKLLLIVVGTRVGGEARLRNLLAKKTAWKKTGRPSWFFLFLMSRLHPCFGGKVLDVKAGGGDHILLMFLCWGACTRTMGSNVIGKIVGGQVGFLVAQIESHPLF